MELVQTVVLICRPHSDAHVTYIPAVKSVWRQSHFAKSQEQDWKYYWVDGNKSSKTTTEGSARGGHPVVLPVLPLGILQNDFASTQISQPYVSDVGI